MQLKAGNSHLTKRRDGTKPVKQIEFAGERLDLASVRKWREKVLAENR